MPNSDEVEYVLRTIEERGIRYVRLWFTDVLGFLKAFTITSQELEGALTEGMGFDGSSIDGFSRIQESDMVAVPDPSDVTRPRWASFSLREGALGRATGSGPVLAVTVVGKTAAAADEVVAAALPLASPDALALMVQRGATGFVQTRDGAGRFVTTTPGFAAARDLRPEEGVVVRP